LSLYSGPANPSRDGATVIRPRLKRWPLAKIGWLGTGDAPLRTIAKICAFETHLRRAAGRGAPPSCCLTMAPFITAIPNGSLVNADIYFAAADPTRDDWKHPAPQLRQSR
jgi:hypothetical protein